MPAPARTSTAAVVAAGREIVESDGVEALTMQRVAERVGIRAPSLYKRVGSRSELVRMVADQVALDLAQTLDEVRGSGDPEADLRAVAAAFRSFAHRNRATYSLVFEPGSGGVSPEARDRSSIPVLEVARALAGDDDALPAARTIVAWAQGFLTMELNGAFQLGGDVDEAWEYGVAGLVRALRG
jgi:AcrR family transcriptional regulator